MYLLKQLFEELGVQQSYLLKLFCDNLAALHMVSESDFHDRTKQIEVDGYFVQENLHFWDIVIIFVS